MEPLERFEYGRAHWVTVNFMPPRGGTPKPMSVGFLEVDGTHGFAEASRSLLAFTNRLGAEGWILTTQWLSEDMAEVRAQHSAVILEAARSVGQGEPSAIIGSFMSELRRRTF